MSVTRMKGRSNAVAPDSQVERQKGELDDHPFARRHVGSIHAQMKGVRAENVVAEIGHESEYPPSGRVPRCESPP